MGKVGKGRKQRSNETAKKLREMFIYESKKMLTDDWQPRLTRTSITAIFCFCFWTTLLFFQGLNLAVGITSGRPSGPRPICDVGIKSSSAASKAKSHNPPHISVAHIYIKNKKDQ